MKYNKLTWVATFAVLAAVLLTASATPPSQDDNDGRQVATADTSDIKMASLFDFDAYKLLFKKSYSGLLENMVRFKYFTSRAIRASISAIKFRFRFLKFYLSLNYLSDKSPEELDRMRNKMLESKYKRGRASKSDDLPEFIPDDDENVVASLRRLIDDNAGKPEFEALREQLEQVDTARKQQQQSPSRRRKREVELAEEGPRELPLSNLINVAPENPDAQLPAETRAKIRARPKSNNPMYEGFELPTQGLVDQQTPLNKKYSSRPKAPQVNLADSVSKTLESMHKKYMGVYDDGAPVKLPNEVFFDLRTSSNCLFAPRAQGECGACYAFSVTTVAEWLHCHTTGELVALSEQYMIDCGKAYQADDIDGCAGGTLEELNTFFHNFGWELLSAYPYMAREQQCPYEPDTDLRTVGYIRANMRNAVEYDVSVWPEALKAVGPLAIQMSTGLAYDEYRAGVYDACEPGAPDHGAVLIGHGREDGEEYWLIRNSYATGWGEAGHMKLSKKTDCIWPRTGWSWGSDDGYHLKVKPVKNSLNDGQAVRRHHDRQSRTRFRYRRLPLE